MDGFQNAHSTYTMWEVNRCALLEEYHARYVKTTIVSVQEHNVLWVVIRCMIQNLYLYFRRLMMILDWYARVSSYSNMTQFKAYRPQPFFFTLILFHLLCDLLLPNIYPWVIICEVIWSLGHNKITVEQQLVDTGSSRVVLLSVVCFVHQFITLLYFLGKK